MDDTPLNAGNLVDVTDLAQQLDLPVEWLENEAKHSRIPRLLVIGPYRRRIYRFSPQAVRDCLAMRASLGDSASAKAGQEKSS